jgi:hypothetical protein
MPLIKSQPRAATKGPPEAARILRVSDERTSDRLAPGVGTPPGGRCLSADELRALQSVDPGQLPAEVAVHLAGCERCQRQALFGSEPAAGRRKPAPSLREAFLRVVIVLVALAMVLVSIWMLVG